MSCLHELAAHIALQGTANVGIPSRGYSTPMEACVRRVWLEYPPLSAKALEELKGSLAEWEAWKQSRAEQVGPNQRPFSVSSTFTKKRGKLVDYGLEGSRSATRTNVVA